MEKPTRSLIPEPCPKKWSELGSDETLTQGSNHITTTARHCDQCDHHVHDISDMTRSEILALKSELGGKLCGMICSKDKKLATPLSSFTKPLVVGTGIASLALASCTPSYQPVLGRVAIPPYEKEEPDPFPVKQTSTKKHPALGPNMVIGMIAEQ